MTDSTETSEFRLKDHLSPSLVETALKATDKEQVIDELLNILDRNDLIDDLSAARQAVMDREKSMSTGMQHGVALPHGKTDTVQKLVCAVGLKREGIDFNSIDGELSKVFVIMLSPLDASGKHLQFMSTIGRVLNGTGADPVLGCSDEQEIVDLLSRPPENGNGKKSASQ